MSDSSSVSTTAAYVAELMSRRHPAASLNRRYLAALLCIAGLIVLDQLLIQPALSQLTFDAPVINVSGRQRMLSQRLTKTALVLVQETEPARRRARRQELSEVVALWTRSHVGLQQGDRELSLPGRNPAKVTAAFMRLEPHFAAMRDAALRLAALPDEQLITQSVGRGELATLLEHEPRFLTQMNAIVGLYEGETRSRVRQLVSTGWTIAVGILATMWLLHTLAIRPATQLLERQYVETQDQYQAVIDSISEGLLRLNPQGQILYANEQIARLAGRPRTALRGLSAYSLFPAQQLAWLGEPSLPAGAMQAPREWELRRSDGSTRTCWVSPCRLTNEAQGTTGWIVLVMDVTEQRAAERRTQALADQLAHADRLKSMGEIAAGLAHEVNQPLGAIANFAEGSLARLEQGATTADELEQPLRRILSAALRAGGIIRRVKQFSQKRPHTVAEADLNHLIRETIDLFASEWPRRRVRCDLEPAAEPLVVECDALQIGQVLTNVVQNALHALEGVTGRERTIRITATRAEDGGRITIRDNGPGIPPAVLDRLFEPFSTTRPDGLGMGLSIVRSIMEAHGGTITAENDPAGGACVTIRLPVRQTETPGANVRPASVVSPPEKASHVG